ncbi:hypothetical protein E8E12_002852 [Didymella heteroderae]|uniref:Frequency clock protein n=1 Tax=Didymella heteroderae TaxID=1769908 RepID=A0A9P4WH57_9PLEO|nr:hypothetical protein E8E12_002852 [Didymella heteroderae]
MDERARPGTVPGPAPVRSSHPRRPPANKSVSLRHSPPTKPTRPQRAAPPAAARVGRQSTTLSTSPTAPASDKANPPSSISPRLHVNHHSSGESSDAAGWFEKTNNDMGHDASFVDNDPPFLLHNSSSSERTPPDGHGHGQHLGMPPLPYRPTLMNLGTDGSSTEDFRSVIDDLTIANKKLKQRLRKYEKVYDAHLQEEKLFEVRFHGLPDHKKKELEETLRNFAAGLDDSPERPEVSLSHVPALNKEVTASSTSRFAESGYASMSASGQNSSTPSNGASNQPALDNRRMTKSAYNRQQQSIQSYLHDIPQGLLPQDNAHMSAKARKKMVVRRLEQIFAGKRSVPGQHPQPMQQEEVAQSAATADRREREATGRDLRPEGQRTALIMPEQADAEGEEGGATLHIPAQQRVHEQDFAAAGSGSGSPDQRPTRPLDLDPYRAQVPAANMDYFRHLGFSPPDMTTSTETEEGHGWLYLNLLINLAQLHTLNVTPDNVKDAIAEYSTKLELSSDGRKIRWKGGYDFSKDSSDGSPEQMGSNSPYQTIGAPRSPQKSSKTGNSASNESSGYGGSNQSRNMVPAKPQVETSKFAYKPLFFRKDSSEEEQDFYDQTESSGSQFHPQRRGDSSGLGSSALHSNLSGKRRDDGPMIFYNKARFCTDLTGDRVGASLTLSENYKTITSHPLGAQLSTERTKGSEIWEARGPLDDAAMDSDSKTGAQTPSTLESLGFSPAELQGHISATSADGMDFEVSGLGGVQPDDNFSICVQRAHIPTAPAAVQSRRLSLYPSKIQAILGEEEEGSQERRRSTSPKGTIKEKLISAVRKDMPSSTLPPPSFFPFDSNSSGEMSDDEESSDNGSDTGDGPSTALQLLNIAPPGHIPVSDQTDISEASEYSSDDDDDVSIDLLATARQQDPETIRAFEREYDAAVADRLAEEIVAGSSAATAGGGSGFNSPSSEAGQGQSKQGSRRSTRNAQSSHSEASLSPRSRNLKRERTSESIATVMKNGPKAPKTQRTE